MGNPAYFNDGNFYGERLESGADADIIAMVERSVQVFQVHADLRGRAGTDGGTPFGFTRSNSFLARSTAH